MSDVESPAPEAAGEDVADVQAPEQPEADETEGQVETPPAEDEGETPEAADEPDEPPKKTRGQRRREYVQQLQAELSDAKSRLARLEQANQNEAPPVEADFEDYDDYRIAKALHKQSQSLNQREADQAKLQAQALEQQQAREVSEIWNAQVHDAKSRYQDFDAVALSPHLAVSDTMAEVITASDVGPDVLYKLGTNPAEARRIAGLSPLEQARELGRIEASLSRPKPKTQTNAPDPIAPVRPKAAAVKSPDKMTMAEYRKARQTGELR